MISILLMSDIHFGNTTLPFIDDSVRLTTFQKICMIARTHTIFIIAGDLFEGAIANTPYLTVLQQSLHALLQEGITVLYIPGEAEMRDSAGAATIKEIPVTALLDSENAHFVYTANNEELHFYSGRDTIQNITKISSDGFHIGIFHVELNQNNSALDNHSFSVALLKSMPLDFYALGHHHNFSMFKYKDKIIGAYPGSPEAVALHETGDRYVLSITVDNNEIQQIKRITVNTIRIENLIIVCDEIHSDEDIKKRVQPYNKHNVVLHCILEGKRSFDANSINNMCDKCAGVIVDDRSRPSAQYICAQYEKERTLRGYFFTELQKSIPHEVSDQMVELITTIENTCAVYKGDL